MDSSLAVQYQKKTDREHVLDNPDTYCGSMEKTEFCAGMLDAGGSKIIRGTANVIPGLYKLFDEAIVNARDHFTRQLMRSRTEKNAEQVKTIEVNIAKDGTVSVKNDGPGIPIEKHPVYNIWIPELIFANLRTSSNYNKAEKKRTGGKNGLGGKLIFIWSTTGRIVTVDGIRQKKYEQVYERNLEEICKPRITSCKQKSYTLIEFKPDFKRLGVSNFSSEMLSILRRRVYDIAAVTGKSVKVKLNGEIIQTRTFDAYISLYIGDKSEAKRIHEIANSDWEYAVALSKSDKLEHVSFVNGLYTAKGGKHVDYIVNQIVRKLCDLLLKKKKVKVRPAIIREQLSVFIKCDVDNPSFDSQTKDYLTTAPAKFGSSCTVSDKFIEKVAALGVLDTAYQIAEIKDKRSLSKTDGAKRKCIRGIPSLVDANDAGGVRSLSCMLMLVEGGSAKAGVVSGLTQKDRKSIGVYALRGKLMNVRGEKVSKVATNKEINDIKKIVGLEAGKEYSTPESRKSLRYGKIVLLVDQDKDGSHIKGLCLNLFDSQWPGLLRVPGFVSYMNTPIIRATKGKECVTFYNEVEYNEWLTSMGGNLKSYRIKYYKGLGTSSAVEFKEYMRDKVLIDFDLGDRKVDSLDLVFNKKRAQDRKAWLANYDPKAYNENTKGALTVKNFVDREMIHFSKYDNERSIPSLIDGLKTSQRKIIYAAFQRNLVKEVKVSQFSGYVSEKSAYHHGEASLNACIVGLAQDFVGSNNINLLYPSGQFGTRLQGGKDSASDRYIFTRLEKITRYIFRSEDDIVLKHREDDGLQIEPECYYPIIPMILVNGAKGIGTGFSTDIPCHNPIDIIEYISEKLEGLDSQVQLVPFYNKFKGTISESGETAQKFIVEGILKVNNKKGEVEINELPVGLWTDDYKGYLEKLIDDPKLQGNIKSYIDSSTDTDVNILVKFNRDYLASLSMEDLKNKLKLIGGVSESNMHVFDQNERLVKVKCPKEIIDRYYAVRLAKYKQRKELLLVKLAEQLTYIKGMVAFISGIINNEITISNKPESEIYKILENCQIPKKNDTYDYLLAMSMKSLCKEKVDELTERCSSLEKEHRELSKSTPEQIWLSELEELKAVLLKRRGF